MLFLDFRDESDHCGVELSWERLVRRFFVDDAGAQRFVSLGEGLDGAEDVGIHGGGLDGAEFGDGESECGHQLLVGVDDILRDFFVEQRRVRWQGALVPVFVTVGGKEIGAIGGAVDSDFALGAAADGADFLTLSRAKANCFALFANRAGHGVSSLFPNNRAGYAAPQQKTKKRRATAHAMMRLIQK